MSRLGRELRDAAVDLAAGDIRVRAGFRLLTREPLAGGPIELEFFVENVGPSPLQLPVGADRMRQRPGQFSVEAVLARSPIVDPMADVPDLGGPLGVVAVTPASPWRQPLVLNDFVRLEDTVAKLAAGGSARLHLRCRRPIALASTAAAALASAAAPAHTVAVELAFDLRRDDTALARLVARLLDEVTQGPPAGRERPLAMLLSMRATARAQIEALTTHADQAVADRARAALTRSA